MKRIKDYSTSIIPRADRKLLFTAKSESYFYHCWNNSRAGKYVVIREPRDMRILEMNQLLNFRSFMEMAGFLWDAGCFSKK